jgi:hypothetical protein
MVERSPRSVIYVGRGLRALESLPQSVRRCRQCVLPSQALPPEAHAISSRTHPCCPLRPFLLSACSGLALPSSAVLGHAAPMEAWYPAKDAQVDQAGYENTEADFSRCRSSCQSDELVSTTDAA